MRRRVVITGMGAVTPLGNDATALWEGWTSGTVALGGGIGACTDFDPAAALSRKEVRRTDRFAQLGLVAAAEALTQAGWDGGCPYEPHRAGCVWGTQVGGIATIEESLDVLRERGIDAVSPFCVPALIANAAAAGIALRHGLTGPSCSVCSACASGGQAIGWGADLIRVGLVDAMVAGGSEAPLTRLGLGCFQSLGALSPTGRSLPFDARRDGFVLGEGAGVLVLEEAAAAAARGATVLGEVLGSALTDDAHHITAPDPGGEQAARAMRAALEDAGLEPHDVDYVNAHGTGTALNDAAEVVAIRRALGDHADDVPVSSLKSAIGHLIGGAGAVEAVATVRALSARVAPPTLGWEQPDEGLDLDFVPNTPRPLDVPDGRPAVGLSNSFGFGGHNAVLCLAGAA